MGGDVGDIDVIDTRLQIEGQYVPYNSKLLVVNRDSGLVGSRLLLCRARGTPNSGEQRNDREIAAHVFPRARPMQKGAALCGTIQQLCLA
jgi:hypothetical protein